MVDALLEIELDAPLSPRRPGIGADASAVHLVDDEDAGRILRISRPVRRGEALLAEEPLFLAPCSDEEFALIVSSTCDAAAVEAAAAAAGAEPPHSVAPSGMPPSSTACPPSASWMAVWEQLTLVVVRAFLEDEESQSCEDFRNLRGDAERWQGPASPLWHMLREDVQASFTFEALCEIYATVAENAFQTEEGRAGIFNLGSYAEHSCVPNAFKEVFVPIEHSSRPASPCTHDSDAPPGSPSRGVFPPIGMAPPQLVIRALHDLAEGDVVTLAKVQEYLPTWRRQELLQATYGMTCVCDRCERKPELVCAYRCPQCGSAPCCPTLPLQVPGLQGQALRCESCGDLELDEQYLAALVEAENEEGFSDEVGRLIHPFHHKYFLSYLANLQGMAADDRISAIETMLDALQRLSGSDGTPLFGKLVENMANAQLDLGEHHLATAGFRRAQEMYSISHRGLPDAGHDARCYQQETRVTAGPLGAAPRRLSRVPTGLLARSPSLPSLAEGLEEEPEDC